ncbi:hypothetical protein AB0J82_18185 [Asanoa sp. NPDC049518]|uniref:hypothetical protein n=1 Tax=unclassified Asanoa TaxID=2685164 RepID=UPI00343B563B
MAWSQLPGDKAYRVLEAGPTFLVSTRGLAGRADLMTEAYSGLVILQARQVWVNHDREEHRTFHHNGDGTFNADGDLIDLRDRMVVWKAYQD